MKKLSRKPINPLGFTLIELLVVVAIIAILSAVGITIFINAQKGARDAKRKADINSIASAYESKFNSINGEYSELADADFQSGKMPTPPEGGNYNFVVGPNHGSSEKGLYKVCAKLGDITGSCGITSSSCYCRSSSQSAASAVTAGVCNNFQIGGVAQYSGASQVCYTRVITSSGGHTSLSSSDIWVKCGDIAGSIRDCTLTREITSCDERRGRTGNMVYYASSADAAAGTSATLQVEIASYACSADYWPSTPTVHLY